LVFKNTRYKKTHSINNTKITV